MQQSVLQNAVFHVPASSQASRALVSATRSQSKWKQTQRARSLKKEASRALVPVAPTAKKMKKVVKQTAQSSRQLTVQGSKVLERDQQTLIPALWHRQQFHDQFHDQAL